MAATMRLIIVYFLLAYLSGWWPFAKETRKRSGDPQSSLQAMPHSIDT